MTPFFSDWLHLITWVFFKPTALQSFFTLVDSGSSAHKSTGDHPNPSLRHIMYIVLTMLILPCLVMGVVGLSIQAIGWAFAWKAGFHGLVSGMALGTGIFLTWGLMLGLTWGLPRGITLGLGWSLALGMAGGIAEGVSSDVLAGIVWGMSVGFAGCLAVTLESGLAWGVAGGLIVGLVSGLAGGIAGKLALDPIVGLGFSIAVLLGVLRVPLYIVEIIPALWRYHHACLIAESYQEEKKFSLSANIKRSPVYFDELLILPQPLLPSFLLLIARYDLNEGLQHIARVACNPFQRWASQRAIRALLEWENRSFFEIVHHLLATPVPYYALGGSEYKYTQNPYFTSCILLSEIANVPPISGLPNELLGFSDGLAQSLTSWLRLHHPSPYEPLSLAYLYLLTNSGHALEMLQRVLPLFKKATHLDYGEEIYQTFHVIRNALCCQYLAEVARSTQDMDVLLEIETPLRPGILEVLERLNLVSVQAMVFLSGEHPVNLRDALLKAQGYLEDARRLSQRIYQPEQRLLLDVIEHWRKLFVTEGEQIAQGVEVEVLPNPYVAGRALAPSDGKLFVGRQDIFRQIEETLHTGVTIVLYGQRRIGKTSILLYLRDRLSHTLLPVYFNLQLLQADTTAGLLYSLSKTIAEHLEKVGRPAPILPTLDTFHIEPFLTFDQFLGDVERSVQLGQRVVLIFDEFEELEKQVNEGHVDRRIFTFLRGLTQTRHGFVLIFAGLHTLEQMSYSYWHPFFLSVKPIKVSYLSQTEAWSLITGPVDEFPLKYDKRATDRIIEATRGQPYLIQALCFNLVTYLNNPLHRSNRTTLEHVNIMLDHTVESGSYYFEDYFWGHSSPDEQMVIAIVADAVYQHQKTQPSEDEDAQPIWVSFSTIERYLGHEVALNVLKNLCARDVLEERVVNDTEMMYRFQVELLRLWVTRTRPLARVLLEHSIEGNIHP